MHSELLLNPFFDINLKTYDEEERDLDEDEEPTGPSADNAWFMGMMQDKIDNLVAYFES